MQHSESTMSSTASNSKSTFSANQDEIEITNVVRSILEESQQIAELTEMEKVYSAHVVTRFSEITSSLRESYHIKPESMAKNDSSVTDAVLTPNGMILIYHNNQLVTSTPLESIKCDDLLRILEETIPKAELFLKEKQQKIGQRVITLEKLVTEIRKITPIDSRREQREISRNLEKGLR